MSDLRAPKPGENPRYAVPAYLLLRFLQDKYEAYCVPHNNSMASLEAVIRECKALIEEVKEPRNYVPDYEFVFPCKVTRENYVRLAKRVGGKDHDSHGVCITLNEDRGPTVDEGHFIYQHFTAGGREYFKATREAVSQTGKSWKE